MKKLILLIPLLVMVACAPIPPPTVEPTYTPLPPLPTHTSVPPLPTYTAFPTFTPFPTAVLSTDVPPTVVPPTEVMPTAVPIFVKVLGTTTKLLLREVCYNVNGFIYNLKGFPVLTDCIYPLKGKVSDRIKYLSGNKIEVEEFGDLVFEAVHGFQTNKGKMTIKADGGGQWYVAIQRGANGQLLFIAAWLVKIP